MQATTPSDGSTIGLHAPAEPPAVLHPQAAMRIELRKVEYSARLSEETPAFSADIWIDGVWAGHARNHGQGGPTMIGPRALALRLDDYGRTLPADTVKGDLPFVVQPDGEWLIGKALNDWILRRDMKRALRNRVVFTRSDKPGLFQTAVLKPAQLQQTLASTAIRQKWNVQVFLNALPEEHALRLYREQGAG